LKLPGRAAVLIYFLFQTLHDSKRVSTFAGADKSAQLQRRLRLEGFKGAQAAKHCHISKNTASRWAADGEVKARIAFLTEHSLQNGCDEEDRVIRPITFGRNDLIMTLWEIGTKGDPERARVPALLGLADIFLLRAKCIQDLRTGVGWTDDEALEFSKTEVVPERIAQITGDRTVDDLARAIYPPRKRKNGN